jgi:site-specific recombinase XerD/ribosomal protein L40E
MGTAYINIEKAVEKIREDAGVHSENKRLIIDFKRHLEATGDYSDNRIYKYMVHLRRMAEHIDVPFNKATKEDIDGILLWIHNRKLSPVTKSHYRIMLKTFYKWLNGGEYPECVKHIKATEKKGNRKLPHSMLSPGDVVKLIKAARNPRDRALIAMLWETGARIDELLTLKVGDLEDHREGMKLVVKGKTGERRLILIDSVPYINVWLKAHPDRSPEAPLWAHISTRGEGGPVAYQAVKKALNRAARLAEITKPVNPHHFRHSRATYMANHFTEAQMCEWFGWVPGSDVPGRYVHLSGRDIDNAYMRMHGVKVANEGTDAERIEFITCARCGTDNGPTARFCGNCGMALDLKAGLEAMTTREQNMAMLADLLNNDAKFRKDFIELLKESARG